MISNICTKMACPACGQYGAMPFFYNEKQPLATLGWPESIESAQEMKLLPLDFVSCIVCSHVFNESFSYSDVPYSDNPNRMYNSSKEWMNYLANTVERLAATLPSEPTVIEIGCGEGHFLRDLSKRFTKGKFIGFDPNGSVNKEGLIDFHKELFSPSIHMEEFNPDLIICRHVVEHLTQPLALFQPIMKIANSNENSVKLFIEVPCIDNLYKNQRVSDFFYEHISNFNSNSFNSFISLLGGKEVYSGKGYGDEVIFTCIESVNLKYKNIFVANDFYENVKKSKGVVCKQLYSLLKSNKKIAIWGGTGKSASFINYYQLNANDFPLVVDSDKEKSGYYVPGTGQKIQFRDLLLDKPVDVIIIPPQWRANDILKEIHRVGIHYENILIEDNGQLIDFEKDENIYFGEK